MNGETPVASTSKLPEPTVLPYITVQHDLLAVIQDVQDGTVGSESFWVSVYRQGSPTVHGKVSVRASQDDENEVELDAQDGISFERAPGSSTSFYVSCKALQVDKTLIKLPKQAIRDVLPKGIDSMDISPDGKLFVAGGRDGQLEVGSLHGESSSPIKLQGHVGDILSCRFFPSAQVVLSTSSDLSCRIFSASDGTNPRTLSGHTAAVTDCAIIGRGKQVLTSGNDGTVRLWHVGEGKCTKSWRVGRGSQKRVTKVILCSFARGTEESDDLDGQVAIAGLEDGHIALVDLKSTDTDPPRSYVHASASGKAISAIALAKQENGYRIAVGTVNGQISLFSLASSSASLDLLGSCKRNDADVTSLAFAAVEEGRLSLLVGMADGLPFQLSLAYSGEVHARVDAELAGYDIDACNSVRFHSGEVFAAGRDGHLRRY